MGELNLEDDLEGLSAEELEKLAEQDDGEAKLENDEQNFVTEGITDLNKAPEANADEPGEEEEPPADEPPADEPPADEEPKEPEIDYEAEYNRQNAILARERLLEAEGDKVPPVKEPEPELTGEELYTRAAEATKLSESEQTKYDSFKEYDEDQAELYKQSIVNRKLLADVFKQQNDTTKAANTAAANTAAANEKSWNDVISTNDNMKKWQQDPEEWADVNSTFKTVSRSKGFGDLSKADQIALVEKRHLAVTGQAVSETPKPVKPAPNIDKKIADAEKIKPPSSLSSVASTTNDGKPGRIKVDNGSDASDLQMMFDNADPDDPEAIDKIMSSMDFGG